MKYFKKEQGKITTGRKRLFDALARLEDGEWGFEVKEWKDSRSLRQNNLMWKWIDILKDYHGYEKNEMYDAFIEEFAPIYTSRDLQGKPIQKKLTTSKMDTEQMSDFMGCIDRHAAEFDVQLPRPEEELISP